MKGFKERLEGLLATLLVFSLSVPARADFSDGMSSAAAEGLGDAGVAMAGEASSLFVNPASLAALNRADLSLMYAKPLSGVPDISLQQGVLAVGLPKGERLTLSGGVRAFDNAGLSKEYEGAAGAGFRLTEHLSAGAAVSFLRREYNVDSIPGASSDPVFAKGTSKSGIGIDAGLLYEASETLTLGASGRRLNQPDMGLVAEDKAPMTWRAGGAMKHGSFTFVGELRGKSESTSADSKWGAGVEWKAMQPLTLRVGADSGKVAAGMGVGIRGMRLDYAFSFTQDLGVGESGSHRVSIGYAFGPERGEVAVNQAAKPVRTTAPRSTVRPATKKAPTSTGAVSTRDTRAYPTANPVPRKAPKRKAWVR